MSHLRGQGITTPVIPGILPIQSFDSLRRVLSLCGANIPGKLYLSLEKAHNEGGAEAVRQVGLDYAVRQIRNLLMQARPASICTRSTRPTCVCGWPRLSVRCNLAQGGAVGRIDRLAAPALSYQYELIHRKRSRLAAGGRVYLAVFHAVHDGWRKRRAAAAGAKPQRQRASWA